MERCLLSAFETGSGEEAAGPGAMRGRGATTAPPPVPPIQPRARQSKRGASQGSFARRLALFALARARLGPTDLHHLPRPTERQGAVRYVLGDHAAGADVGSRAHRERSDERHVAPDERTRPDLGRALGATV